MLMGERPAEDGVVNGRPAGESSEDEKLQAECLRYFRERPVFGKLLRGFREKYLSYGRFAGTVTLKNLKESEREDLEEIGRAHV